MIFRLAVVSAATCLAAPSLAQRSADQDNNAGRDEIVVNGQNFVVLNTSSALKSDAPIISTPQSVSVVNDEFIDSLNL